MRRRRRRKSGKSLPVVQHSVPVAGVEQASLNVPPPAVK